MTLAKSPMFRALAAGVRGNVPVYLEDHPGRAKTSIINGLSAAWGMHCETIIGSSRDRTDFLGQPIEVDGMTSYSLLGWAHRLNDATTGSIMFIDELTTAPIDVQPAMLRPIQERVVGETPLADHVRIIAAGNPPESAAMGQDLAAALSNRFMHLAWAFPREMWAEGILSGFDHVTYPTMRELIGQRDDQWAAQIAGLVVGFTTAFPQHLDPAPPNDPASAGKAWPSPRMWHNAVKALAELPANDTAAQHLILQGCVGEGVTVAFQQWRRNMDLPSPEKVLDDPFGQQFDRMRPDQLFATLAGVRSYLAGQDMDNDTWLAACDVTVAVAEQNRPDVGTPLASWLIANKPSRKVQTPTKLRDAYMELFTDMGVLAAPTHLRAV